MKHTATAFDAAMQIPQERWMREALARRKEEGTLRELRTVDDDQCFVDFTSNDYLGLGRSNELQSAVKQEESRALLVNLQSNASYLIIDERYTMLGLCLPPDDRQLSCA